MFSIPIKTGNWKKWETFIRHGNWNWPEFLRSLGKNGAILLLIGYLFYDRWWIGCLGILLLPKWIRRDLEQAKMRKKERLGIAFREALQSMSAALHAGYAAENAVREAIRDLRTVYGDQAEIVVEFRRMWNEIQMQIPLEQVWRNFGERSDVPVIREFAVIFQTAKRSGGDLTAIMDNTAAAISEKLEVQQEIDTLLAAKKLEWKIMSWIPFAIILYMKWSFTEFFDAMYGNPAGIVVMSVALVVVLAARRLGDHMLEMGIWK